MCNFIFTEKLCHVISGVELFGNNDIFKYFSFQRVLFKDLRLKVLSLLTFIHFANLTKTRTTQKIVTGCYSFFNANGDANWILNETLRILSCIGSLVTTNFNHLFWAICRPFKWLLVHPPHIGLAYNITGRNMLLNINILCSRERALISYIKSSESDVAVSWKWNKVTTTTHEEDIGRRSKTVWVRHTITSHRKWRSKINTDLYITAAPQ